MFSEETPNEKFYKSKVLDDYRLISADDNNLFTYIRNENGGHTVWQSLIKRDLVLKYPFEIGRLYEDTPVIIRCIVDAGKFACTKSKLYYHRTRSESICTSDFSYKQTDIIWCCSNAAEFFAKIGYRKMAEFWTKKYCYYSTWCFKGLRDTLNDRKAAERVRRESWNFLVKYRRFWNPTKNDLLLTFDTFYPKITNIYWLSLTAKNRLLSKMNKNKS